MLAELLLVLAISWPATFAQSTDKVRNLEIMPIFCAVNASNVVIEIFSQTYIYEVGIHINE